MRRSPNRSDAYTLVEMIVSVAVILSLALLLVRPAGRANRGKAQRIRCVDNLKNLSLATRIYSLNYHGRSFESFFATTNSGEIAHYFRALSNEISTPNLLVCPTDLRARPAANFTNLTGTNISYFLNRTARFDQPEEFLFGDRNLSTNRTSLSSRAILQVSPDRNIHWTKEMHVDLGIIAMSDGSVRQFHSQRLREQLSKMAHLRTELLFP